MRKDKRGHQALLILPNDDDYDEDDAHHPTTPITSAAMMLSSWLRTRRTRYLFLALCSPLLLPFLCASFPFLCAAEICLRLCHRRRSSRLKAHPPEGNLQDRGGDGLRRYEEGGGVESEGVDEVRLLQRYLEDQLLLVVGSVYDCGDDEDGNCGLDDEDDVEFFGSSRSRLLPC
ncbi:hypothetical protein F0562_028285 [Nyssa sinensis]|uniref:Uncharacterized protein n=1 Tax=Nyssa sinensis TaxID=561372 RepID=A0A5J5BA91_9ASTE|nr:hypothetical protein F0562_028285 [Nyssa sinensis]